MKQAYIRMSAELDFLTLIVEKKISGCMAVVVV